MDPGSSCLLLSKHGIHERDFEQLETKLSECEKHIVAELFKGKKAKLTRIGSKTGAALVENKSTTPYVR